MGDLCFQDGEKVLFIGDSITDCGRRAQAAPLGDGYVSLLHDLVIGGWPERNITWVNKGIGGNKVTDLQLRWEDDVIREQPDWLSIKIGINDLHTHLRGDPGGVSPAIFREVYEEILARAAEKMKAELVLITPFYVSTDDSRQSFRTQVLEILPEYIATVEEMAEKLSARLVRLQPMFERQLEFRAPDVFCPEPVHPYRTGHLLIAQEVLRVLCE
ncbi:MAG: SGNH/GDSL hydrolase family protein [Armatimonadota bacterium]|nr:MAG: SGNH/GDSL hydrolase family protein [Armatimonadota bacterium]